MGVPPSTRLQMIQQHRACRATLAMLLCAGALASPEATDAMLFLDGRWIQSQSDGLASAIGRSHLLSVYRDPTAYIGWGYPSVFRLPGGGYRALYEGWANKAFHGTRMVLAADSADGVHFTPLNLSRPAPAGWPPSFDNRNGTTSKPVWPANGVFGPIAGLSCVYDDAAHSPPNQRLKALMKEGAAVYSSPDGLSWNQSFGHWSSRAVDPGFSVFRDPNDSSKVVVTARPQALRAGGRHAGFNAAAGWSGLAGQLIEPAVPLDRLYADDVQSYGLPSFSYAGMVVSFWWRLKDGNCSTGCGKVASALAFSYNSQNWTAFGQGPDSAPGWAKNGAPELFPNVPGREDAAQTYPNTLLEVDGRLLVHASAATHCHGCVAAGWSSLLTYELRSDGFAYLTPRSSSDAQFTTRLVIWRGGDMLVNADALGPASSIAVGVNNEAGEAIMGYRASDASAFRGNSTRVAWGWAGGRMDALRGRKVSFVVTLTGSAKLYAIRGLFDPVDNY